MARVSKTAKTPKSVPTNVEVTIRPWYQTQLAAAIVGALLGLIPYIYDKIQDADEKRDQIGMTFLSQGYPGPFTWSDSSKNSFSVRLVGYSFGESDSWIVARPAYGDEITLGRGKHNGYFYVYLDKIPCDGTFYYRTEAMRQGRKAAGYLSNVYFPKCSTPAEKALAESDPNFIFDAKLLKDPTLPIGHPTPGGFGDEIRPAPTGPNRGNGAQQNSNSG